MKVPVTWRARSPGLGKGGYRGGSAKRSRCYSRISSAFSSSTVYVYEAQPGARDAFILAATAQNLRMGNDGKLADGRKGIRSGGPSLTRQ
jgi:hypothetical protein